ncbi:MAG: TGS domain-containing protein, partial [Fidelibacterota bacterium]
MNKIQITLPDNSQRSVESGVTPSDIALSISEGLQRNSVAAKVNNVLVDLNSQISSDSNVELITNRNDEAHEILLHSTAHLMAQAVKELYPEAKITIGPALKNQFYYDFDIEEILNEDALVKIEARMKEISKR